jgi:hypothetical protein
LRVKRTTGVKAASRPASASAAVASATAMSRARRNCRDLRIARVDGTRHRQQPRTVASPRVSSVTSTSPGPALLHAVDVGLRDARDTAAPAAATGVGKTIGRSCTDAAGERGRAHETPARSRCSRTTSMSCPQRQRFGEHGTRDRGRGTRPARRAAAPCGARTDCRARATALDRCRSTAPASHPHYRAELLARHWCRDRSRQSELRRARRMDALRTTSGVQMRSASSIVNGLGGPASAEL